MRFTKAQQEIINSDNMRAVFLFEGRQQGATTALIHKAAKDAQEKKCIKCVFLVHHERLVSETLWAISAILGDAILDTVRQEDFTTIFLDNESTIKIASRGRVPIASFKCKEHYYIDDYHITARGREKEYFRLTAISTNRRAFQRFSRSYLYVRFFSVFEAVDDIFMSLINENRAKHGYKELDRFEFIKQQYYGEV